LSGTPIKDKVYDVAYILNLLLPDDKQLPIGKAFMEKYIDPETNLFKKESIQELRDYFVGRISFFRANFESITQINMGEQLGDLQHLKIYPSYMSEHQTGAYQKALEADTKRTVNDGNKKRQGGVGIFSNCRQASLCVDMQGNWGTKINIGPIMEEIKKKNEFEKLKVIEKYSTKYAQILRDVLNNPKQNIFVYNTFVKGSGINVFKLFMEEFGYRRSEGNESTPGRRFAVITNELSNPLKTMRILKLFNSDKNVNGEYIQVIIGSKVANEGLTLKNVRQAHIVAPFWNFTDIEQAIARTIRLNSHQALIDAGQPANISIYMHAAAPHQGANLDVDDDDWNLSDLDDLMSEDESDKDDVLSSSSESDEEENVEHPLEHVRSPIEVDLKHVGEELRNNLHSIDLYMYYKSEQKDLQNRQVERQMKEMAFDCLLNKENNAIKGGKDGSRECDYTSCVLQCNNQSKLNSNVKIEFDSYNILYDKEYKSSIITCLSNYFLEKNTATLEDLMAFCKNKYSEMQFKYTIADMIVNVTPIKDRFGIQHFIQYNNENDIHLVYTFNSTDNFYENNYWMQIQDNSIQQFLIKLSTNKDLVIINKIIETDDEAKKWKLVKQLSSTNFDELLKMVVTSTNTTPLKTWILKKFDSLIITDPATNNVYITKNTFSPWKYDAKEKKWSVITITSSPDDINTMNQLLADKFSKDALKYYAIYNDNLNTLLLRSTKDLSIMRKGKGKDCISFNVLELLKNVILVGDIIISGDSKPDKKIIQKVNLEFTKEEIESWSPEKLQTVYNVLTMNKEEICQILRDWFEKKGKIQITF
jgi:disulfide oxidoreductase YuzD